MPELLSSHDLEIVRALIANDDFVPPLDMARRLLRTLDYHATTSDEWMRAYHETLKVPA